MATLAVIADDFTGALDTGVQFAERGIETQVAIDPGYDFSQLRASTQVVVIDAETRHMSPGEAYGTVYDITQKARAGGISHLYKKTDSALRGCVGSELSAMLDASGAGELAFFPAYPKQGRVTVDGVQYLDDTPIHESVFGKDPFEPVLHSYIPDLILEQSATAVEVVPKGAAPAWDGGEKRILVFDAVTDADLVRAASEVKAAGKLTVMAGCAGLAGILPDLMEFSRTESSWNISLDGLAVVCGSLNPITKRQILYARSAGFYGIHLTPRQKLEPGYLQSREGIAFLEELRRLCGQHRRLVLDTFGDNSVELTDAYARSIGIPQDGIREPVARRLGEIAKEIAGFAPGYALFLTGGDTLVGFMHQIGCRELQPVREITDGAVLSLLRLPGRELYVITKSGGFGKEDILTDIEKKILRGANA